MRKKRKMDMKNSSKRFVCLPEGNKKLTIPCVVQCDYCKETERLQEEEYRQFVLIIKDHIKNILKRIVRKLFPNKIKCLLGYHDQELDWVKTGNKIDYFYYKNQEVKAKVYCRNCGKRLKRYYFKNDADKIEKLQGTIKKVRYRH